MASPASLMSRSTRSSGMYVDIDRKAVNPPRFRPDRKEQKPGPGSHDPKLEITRSNKFTTSVFAHDDRTRYLGRAGMKPLSVVKRPESSANVSTTDNSETEVTTPSVSNLNDPDFGECPPPGTYSPRTQMFGKQSLANEFVFGKNAIGGQFRGVPRNVLGITSSKSAQQLTGLKALSESLMKSITDHQQRSPPKGVGNGVAAGSTTSPEQRAASSQAGQRPDSVDYAQSPRYSTSASEGLATGEAAAAGEKRKTGNLDATTGHPETRATSPERKTGTSLRAVTPGTSHGRGDRAVTPSTAMQEKFSGVCKVPGDRLKAASLSPRILRKEAEVAQLAAMRTITPPRKPRERDPGPLEFVRSLPWNEQCEWFDVEIRKGPLNLELHRYLVHLQSNPTFKSHRAVAEKEQMHRVMDRKAGKKTPQVDMLGCYQHHWPKFQPERS
ncbi:unnamed protein product [Amoebophrya sp. A120]|nr:unnamed protein product [Amoebophrya sp. A120]|eukprot:GSA120T00018263001.1